MLKVTKLGLGQQAYFEKAVAKGMDDYYSGKGERPGEWHGRLATELGLTGTVSAAQFNALLAGLDPRDPELLPSLAVRTTKPRKVAAYDLTFSAPKSVSVLSVVAELPVRRELHQAHDAAVKAALEFLQDDAVRVRRGTDGVNVEKAPGIVAAAYRHRMSRAQDPHLHTHVVTASIAPGKDGRWTALDARPLYRMAKAAGTIYQAHLRAEVGERLGLRWREPVEGLAELEDIDQGVLDEFSRRRQDLRKAALEQGLDLDDLTIAKRETLALATRDRKTTVDEYPWREGVRARAAEHGLTFHAIQEMVTGREPVMEAGESVGDVLDQLTGSVGLTQMSTAFERPDAIIGVAGSRREGMRAGRVLAATDRLLGRGDVFAVAGSELDRRWTTAELVAAEQRLIADAIGRAGDGSAKLTAAQVARAIERSERMPGEEQRAAVVGVATSGNGVDVIEARAGTGKTYLAGLIREAYESQGTAVIGAAPTGAAARELTDGAGIRSWTIHSLLSDIERYAQGLPPGTVVVLDEAGMADTRHAERLLVEARKAGVKVIAIGDSGQLPSVQAGGWLKAVGDQVGRHEIKETRRQDDAAERRALGALHAGVPQVWLGFAEQNARLSIFDEDEPAIAKAIDAWTSAVAEHGVDQAVLMSRDNAMRTLLNAGARQHWDEQGRLGKRVDFGPIEVAEGDRIICRRNNASHDVDNGTRGTIRAVNEDRVVLEVKGGATRELPASYVAEHVEHAYALTGHGMQGSTVKWAGVVATPEHLTRGWSYTALSRATGTTMLYVSDEGPERDPNQEQEGPELARERDHSTTLWRIAERMTVRDDEDLATSQLPEPFIGAGRAGDRDVVDAPDPATPIQERGAEPQPAPFVLGGAQLELAALQEMDERLALQAQSLPVRELERLDELAREYQALVARKAEDAERLASVPPAPRLGRDQHDRERRHLSIAVDSHDRLLAAMHKQHTALRAHVEQGTGRDARQAREELRGINERRAQLAEQQRERRARLATEAISRPPAWVEQTIGPRPADSDRALGDWKNAIRTVTDAQLRIDPERPLDAGLPDASEMGEGLTPWRLAQEAIQTANRRPARDVVRDLGDDFGPGR